MPPLLSLALSEFPAAWRRADVGDDGDQRTPDRRRSDQSPSATLSNQFLFSSSGQTYYLNNERRDLITVRNLENLNLTKTWELLKWKTFTPSFLEENI